MEDEYQAPSDFGGWSVAKTIMEFMCGIQGYGKNIYKVILDKTTYDELISDPNFVYITTDVVKGDVGNLAGFEFSSEDSDERFFKLIFT